MLVAPPFDVERATLTGEPRSVRNAVEDQGIGFYAFSVSRTAAIASRQPTQNMPMRQLTWFNARGVALAKLGGPARMTELALSPDGRRVLFTRLDGDINVWTLDVERGAEQRLTPGAASHYKGVWSPPDGARVAFGTLTGSAFTLSSVASDGGGSPQVLMHSNFRMEPAGWTPDGKWFYYHFFEQPNPWSLWRIGPGSSASATLFRRDAGAVIGNATISADGRWIAYDSNASGRSEVFVESLETPGRRWQVSPAGGAVPRWRFDQRELYYLAGDGRLTSAGVTLSDTVTVGQSRALFPVVDPFDRITPPAIYDVARDGRVLVAVATPGLAERAPIVVTINATGGR